MQNTEDTPHQDKVGNTVWVLVDTNKGYIKVPVEAIIQKIHKRRKNKYTVRAGNVNYEVPSVYLDKDVCFETALVSLRIGLVVLFRLKKKLARAEDLQVVDDQILNLQSMIDMLLFSSGR